MGEGVTSEEIRSVIHPFTRTYRTILAALTPHLPCSPSLPASLLDHLPLHPAAALFPVLLLSKVFSQEKTRHLSLYLRAHSVLISSSYSIISLILIMNYQVKKAFSPKVKKIISKSGFSQPFQHISLFLTCNKKKKKKEKDKMAKEDTEEREERNFHSKGGGEQQEDP